MKLKDCPCCKRPQSTRTAKKVGRMLGLLLFNCRSCNSTFSLPSEKVKQVAESKAAA